MLCRELIDILEQEVPLNAAESWDNPGFLVGDKDQEVKKVLVVLDITNEVVELAIKENVDFILAHHPVIFSKITKCTSDDFLQRKLLKLIRNDIACYGMHTNYDVCRMCDAAATKLSLSVEGVVEETDHPEFQAQKKGIGFFSTLKEPVTLAAYAQTVKDVFGLEAVMIYGNPEQKIQKIAMVPGSGRSMIRNAVRKGADVLITGDFGHHEGLDAVDMGLCVIDAGHYGLEQVFIRDMEQFLKEKLDEVQVISYEAGSPYHVITD